MAPPAKPSPMGRSGSKNHARSAEGTADFRRDIGCDKGEAGEILVGLGGCLITFVMKRIAALVGETLRMGEDDFEGLRFSLGVFSLGVEFTQDMKACANTKRH